MKSRVSLGIALALFVCAVAGTGARSSGQDGPTHTDRRARPPDGVVADAESLRARQEMIRVAIGTLCSDRTHDPLGSVPIDDMQRRPSMPFSNPKVVVGLARAQHLLPLAKQFVIDSIEQLSTEYQVDRAGLRDAAARVNAVREVEPNMDLRDNAEVIISNPKTINFGTIFLAGLPSDEGMISVLSHELTHIASGREGGLRPLFSKIGRRAEMLTGLNLSRQRSEELTCDLVGTISARMLVERVPAAEPLARRYARAVEHNCVDDDITDEAHLSPRTTMRALLALDPVLMRGLSSSAQSATLFYELR